MTELAVTLDQLIDAVKGLSAKLDKLQDEKVQQLSERMAVIDERLSSTATAAKVAKEETEKLPTVLERVAKLERVVYGLLYLFAAQVVAAIIGGAIWLIKK